MKFKKGDPVIIIDEDPGFEMFIGQKGTFSRKYGEEVQITLDEDTSFFGAGETYIINPLFLKLNEDTIFNNNFEEHLK